MYCIISVPFLSTSSLKCWYSSSAFLAAVKSSFLVKLYSLNSSLSKITSVKCFASKGKNVFMNFISSDFSSSTLFFNTSGYDITIGQL